MRSQSTILLYYHNGFEIDHDRNVIYYYEYNNMFFDIQNGHA